jgi:hypothetical protein
MLQDARYRRLRQICLATDDLAGAIQQFGALFGAAPCYRDHEVGRFGLENVLFALGGQFVEFVAPTKPDTAVSRFLKRHDDPGAYIVMVDTDDLAAARERCVHNQVRVIFDVQGENGGGIQLHPSDTGCAILEIDHHLGALDVMGPYAWAGERWRKHALPARQATIVGVQVVSPRAQLRASLWGRLLDRPIQQTASDLWVLHLDGADICFMQRDEGGERAASILMTVTDPGRVLAVAQQLGLPTTSSCFLFLGTNFELRANSCQQV